MWCVTVGCIKKNTPLAIPYSLYEGKIIGKLLRVGETSHQGQTVFHGKRFIEAHSSYRVNMNSWLHYSLPGKSHKLLQQNILCHFYISILNEGVVYKCVFWLRTKGEKQVGCGPNPAHKRRRNAVKPVSCWSIDTSKIQCFLFPCSGSADAGTNVNYTHQSFLTSLRWECIEFMT